MMTKTTEQAIKRLMIYTCVPVTLAVAAVLPYRMGRQGAEWDMVLILSLVFGFTNVFEKTVRRLIKLRYRRRRQQR